jgi:hypothetical protein
MPQGCDGNGQQELGAEPAHPGVSGGQRAREAAAAPEDKAYGCKVCEMRFISKNQFFKHLCAGGECSRLTGAVEKRDLKTVSLRAKAEQWLLKSEEVNTWSETRMRGTGQHRLVITNEDFQNFLVTQNPDVHVLDQWLTGYGGARIDETSGGWIIGPGFPIADWPQQGHPEASGNNPFWLVAPKLGFAQITKHMVSHYQCNLEAQTKNGETALHLAAYFGHAKVVKTLLDLGANAAHKNKIGETALDSARVAQDEFNKGKFKFPTIAPGKGVRAALRSQAQASSSPFTGKGSTRFDLRTYDVDWPHWTGEGGVIQMLIST